MTTPEHEPLPDAAAAPAPAVPVAQPVAAPSPVAILLKDKSTWTDILQVVGIGYAGALVGALVLLLGLGSAKLPTGTSSTAPSLDLNPIGVITSAVALGFGSSADFSATFMGTNVSGAVAAVPLLVTLLSLAAAAFWARRIRHQRGTLPVTLSAAWAAVCGALFAILVLLLPALFPVIAVPAGAAVKLGVGGIQGFLGAFLLMGLTVWVALGGLAALSSGLRALLAGIGTFVAVGTVVGLLVAVVGSALQKVPTEYAALFPVVAVTAGVWILALGMLCSVNAGAGAMGVAQAQDASLLSPNVNGALIVACVLTALLAALCAIVVLTWRGGVRTPADIAKAAALWAVAGIVLQFLTTINAQGTAAGGFGTVHLGLGLSTVAIWAVWGAAIAALALYFGPTIAAFAPGSLRARFATDAAAVAAPRVPRPAAASPAAAATLYSTEPRPVAPAEAVAGSGSTVSHAQAAATTVASAAATTAPVSAAALTTPVVRERRPMTQSLARILTIGGLLAALLFGVLAAIPFVRNTFYSPTAVVKDYYAALERGDATKALQLTGSQAPGGMSSELLTNEVYGKATDRPTQAAITSSSVSGDTAAVGVSYRRGNSTRTSMIRLNRAGSAFGVVDDWKIVGGAGDLETIAVRLAEGSAPRDVAVNGIKLGKPASSIKFAVLPGAYAVDVLPSTWVNGASTTLTSTRADLDVPASVLAVANEPSLNLTQAALAAVNAKIDDCARSTNGYQPECPFSAAGPSQSVEDVRYELAVRPTYRVTRAIGTDDEWNVDSVAPGSVKHTFHYTNSTYEYPGTSSFTVHAKVHFTNNAVDSVKFNT